MSAAVSSIAASPPPYSLFSWCIKPEKLVHFEFLIKTVTSDCLGEVKSNNSASLIDIHRVELCVLD